jgi:DNA polymerase IV
MLRRAIGEAGALHLHELAWARDPRRVTVSRVEKSVSGETTFDVDVDDPDVIRRTLLALSTKVGARLRAAGYAGRTVAIKVRLSDFRTLSRSRTLTDPTDVARQIFDTAWQLYQVLAPRDKIRLLGVRVEGLGEGGQAPRQLALGEREHGWREAERAADAASARFGGAIVGPASLLRPAPSAPAKAIAPFAGTGESSHTDP